MTDLPETLLDPDERIDENRSLVCISGGHVETHVLSPGTALTIGRDESSDLRIDEPRVSRAHARIHVGTEIEVEDLGSANGTLLNGTRLTPKKRVKLEIGSVVDVASTLFVVQRMGQRRRRRLWAHVHFELRLEEAVERARATRGALSVVRLRIPAGLEAGRIEDAFTRKLRSVDLVAAYAPGEYALLLPELGSRRAKEIASSIAEELEGSTFGLAVFPKDGVTADGLLAKAGRVDADSGEAVIESPRMHGLYRMISQLSEGHISIVFVGETGSGKELAAEAVHKGSRRSSGPFVRLNCAALNETLVESELFGYVKGAFTGALQDKAGLMEAASGGTLFLDEVGEMPLGTQAKLLRAIEQRQVVRVGSVEPRSVDVRFVAATNRDLAKEVQAGRFRQDLYYRLNGATLEVPPLRQRTEEILPLTMMFVERFCRSMARPEPELSDRAKSLLLEYDWPGNVRELRNVIERAVLLCGAAIEPEHLPMDKLTTTWESVAKRSVSPSDELRDRIVAALDRAAGNQTQAAKELGVTRRTLTNWLNTFDDIRRPRKRQ